MTASDFTSFIGKHVKFIYQHKCHPSLLDFWLLVEGVVEGVMVEADFKNSQLLIDDNFYSFTDITFISTLPNPIQ